MALTQQPLRGALSPLSPNGNARARPARRLATRTAYKPVAPSPLKKQSDYAVLAPIKSKPSSSTTTTTTTTTKHQQQQVAAAKPATPKAQKTRKKILCDTPPAVLQDRKGKNEYNRGKQLGEGGFARCFLVQNRDGTLFAAKTVAKASLVSQKMRTKFLGEIAVHKSMQHPNIVHFKECFEDTSNIYMILELCPNKSLMDMLRRRKRFTEPEVRYYLLQLLGALKYMHGKKVIHRDLKLGNIFLDRQMNIKIGDFGLAALLVDETERKMTICGTPNYIAPEVLFGQKGQGHSFEVDLWGVGVIMYAMLCGRPPFQSTDVNSIYERIKNSEFEWPEDLIISHQAKDLVGSLLNRDPQSRPSIDQIANHSFFISGYFPRSIPKEAMTAEPRWPSVSHLGLKAVATARAEWKRNYEECARAAGVGIDSTTGMPIKSTGFEAEKPMAIIPVPNERPPSAASSVSATDNECGDVKKIMERKRVEALRREQKKKEYMLPEALSPRDGHARMRNLKGGNGLRGKALFQPIKPEEIVIREEEEEEEEEEEPVPEEEPVRRTRALEQKPIRRTSADTAARQAELRRTEESAPMRSAALPPRRPTTRSYAAQQREPVATATTTATRVSRPSATTSSTREVRTSRETLEVREPRAPIRPSSSTSLASRTTSASTTSTTSRTTSSTASRTTTTSTDTRTTARPPRTTRTYVQSDLIPLGANLNSRIGRPIPTTTNTSILTSLTPLITSLTALLTNTVHHLPPPPASTLRAVRGYQTGAPSTAIFVARWVDYTNKYGMAYILSDGTCAALFNDNTSLVADSVDATRVEFITQSLFPSDPSDTVFRRMSADMDFLANTASKTSRSLTGKLAVWRRTGNYMATVLDSEPAWSVDPEAAVREPSIKPSGGNGEQEMKESEFLWLTHYIRMRKCVMFRFWDGTVQCNFHDHTKIVFTENARTLRLVTPDHRLRVVSLEDAALMVGEGRKMGRAAGEAGGTAWGREFLLREKCRWLVELCEKWREEGRFPKAWVEAREKKECLVLGEAVVE
ncbi:Pkinase-domain-containing protein [Ascodesmis nigricans]|uniref:Serine/threonine-protein kinase n=1 Tax=Ascodesmis nigricans TaxID=341454 RepID=A0A4S2MYX1_9PEZI|nr:Pkinase-domain-containing protein [Ascodesmis nigricans]